MHAPSQIAHAMAQRMNSSRNMVTLIFMAAILVLMVIAFAWTWLINRREQT